MILNWNIFTIDSYISEDVFHLLKFKYDFNILSELQIIPIDYCEFLSNYYSYKYCSVCIWVCVCVLAFIVLGFLKRFSQLS